MIVFLKWIIYALIFVLLFPFGVFLIAGFNGDVVRHFELPEIIFYILFIVEVISILGGLYLLYIKKSKHSESDKLKITTTKIFAIIFILLVLFGIIF